MEDNVRSRMLGGARTTHLVEWDIMTDARCGGGDGNVGRRTRDTVPKVVITIHLCQNQDNKSTCRQST